jgi:hypothetical protein|tara:strand:+ start:422 stop:616 length:195 start_codon:yes stop_codon:yes gene_type:complete
MADIIGLSDVSSTDASPLKTGGRRKHNMKKKSKGLKDACWKGYEAIGFKMKSGKKVPNCVKKKK